MEFRVGGYARVHKACIARIPGGGIVRTSPNQLVFVRTTGLKTLLVSFNRTICLVDRSVVEPVLLTTQVACTLGVSKTAITNSKIPQRWADSPYSNSARWRYFTKEDIDKLWVVIRPRRKQIVY